MPPVCSSGCGELEGRSDPADNGGCSPYGDGYGCIAWLCRRTLRILKVLELYDFDDGGLEDDGVRGRAEDGWWLELGRE